MKNLKDKGLWLKTRAIEPDDIRQGKPMTKRENRGNKIMGVSWLLKGF